MIELVQKPMGGMECEEDSSVNHAHWIGIGAYE